MDLSTTSAKKVRQQLEEHYGESLANRKDEINELVKEYVNSREESSEDNQSEEDGTDQVIFFLLYTIRVFMNFR